MFKRLRLLFLVLMLTLSILFNVLSITSTVFNAALTGLVAATLGVKTVTAKLHTQVASQKTSVRNMGRKLMARTKRIATYSMAEIPASVLPYAGIALLIAGTAWELKQLCDGLFEMEELYAEMDIDEPLDEGALHAACHPSSWIPSNK